MASGRIEIGSGTTWEREVGYSRVVRTGPHVWVSGTIGIDPEGRIHAPGDMGEQARRALERIRLDLEQVGGRLEHVVRTRIFVTDMEKWPEAARAHKEAFGEKRPASTLMEVSRLVSEDAIVEIEADAYIP